MTLMESRSKLRYYLSAAVIIAGIVLALCGMKATRAIYLILIGVLIMVGGIADFQNEETPKGIRYWSRKVISNILSTAVTLSICNFILQSFTGSMKEVLLWLIIPISIGLLFGTFDYFSHATDCDESEYLARKKTLQEIGEQYDEVVKEMNSEKN